MVADSDHPSIPGRRLAERLRSLREREYAPLTQKRLAKALGASITMVSLWENPVSDRLPPPSRLAAYARLFCTGRSFASGVPRRLGDEELTDEERHREAELYDELLELRERAQSTGAPTSVRDQAADDEPSLIRPGSLWRFPVGQAISIVNADAADPPPYANQSHLNYSQYARFADLDSLVEVFGQVKADNPTSMIRILAPGKFDEDFTLNPVVIVGGAAWREVRKSTPWITREDYRPASWAGQEENPPIATPWLAPDVTPPIARPSGETYEFECSVADECRTFSSLPVADGLAKDIGLIARVPHPIIPGRTVTLLSGITSRGVYGATLCFTDSHVREDNERYLAERLANADTFCIVMNVLIANNIALPPNLWVENTCVWEWSTDLGARW
jgi:transcriptional regulator with XRE-family HTH domain